MKYDIPGMSDASENSGGELERLETFLQETSGLRQPMNLEMLDGYLTALIVGPDTVMPNEWLAFVWDIYGEGQTPNFSSTEQATWVIGTIMRLMNTISSVLNEGCDAYRPLPDMVDYPADDIRPEAAQSWCIGFMLGVELREASWAPLYENREASLAITAILIVAGMFHDRIGVEEPDPLLYWPIVPKSVIDIKSFWKAYC